MTTIHTLLKTLIVSNTKKFHKPNLFITQHFSFYKLTRDNFPTTFFQCKISNSRTKTSSHTHTHKIPSISIIKMLRNTSETFETSLPCKSPTRASLAVRAEYFQKKYAQSKRSRTVNSSFS